MSATISQQPAAEPGRQAPSMRHLHRGLAFLAALFGMGYVYVGRLRAAIVVVLIALACLAVTSWTRLILTAGAAYLLLGIGIGLGLLQIIHPVVIAAREKQAVTRSYNRWWFYVLWVVVGNLALDLITANRGRLFGYETFTIPAASMAPTIEPGDVVMLDAWRYKKSGPKPGELIVFRDARGTDFIKRVVGGPGDELELRNGVVYRNQQPVKEPYLHAALDERPYGRDVPAFKLGESEYYVLGDFRDNSIDSRRFGPITAAQVRGRVEYIAFSLSDGGVQWHRFPTYFNNGT